ncbi:MAG TPA: penicillin acylase family protein [Candidatus Binatia bacterium]|nr:penicillin acylase family protein [Candidatus Binatia bacterium]
MSATRLTVIFHPTARLFSLLLRPLLRHLAKPAAPKYGGEITLAGLGKNVNVFWQSEGIPHVFAADERDLFFAQGYLHAQERLWQMDLNRRFLSGRMAEIFGQFPVPPQELTSQFRGSDSVDVDYFMRLVGIRRSALASADVLSPADRERLQAYSAGVNRFIELCGKRLPLEFRLLRYQPEPWRPEDTLTIGKGFAFLLSLALFTRLNAIPIAAELASEPQRFQDLYPSDAANDFTTTRALWDAAQNLWRFSADARGMVGGMAGAGSNAWVIGPSRSEAGHALLCNDPHLRISLPSIWYLMHLCAAPGSSATDAYEVWGATLPGCPGVQVGHNRCIAWGITAALCDDVELYREKIHRLEPDLYELDGRWQVMNRQRETIPIRGKRPAERTVRWTRHGPVITDFKRQSSSSEVLSLRWTAHEASEDFHALYTLNRARNWHEFLEALSYQAAPALNIVYADNAGNIGFSLAGKVPLRGGRPSALPTEGWRSENEWRGFVPFGDLPRLLNPPQGAIATANNRIVDDGYPFYLSRFFEPPYRVRRIYDLIDAQKIHRAEQMMAAQADKVSIHAIELIVFLSGELAAIRDAADEISLAADRMLRWDGHCGADSIAATIFHAFHQRLIRNILVPVLGDELSTIYIEIFNQSILPIENILRAPHPPWLRGTGRGELVRSALEQACAEIRKTLGPNQSRWQWGRLHTLTLNHPFSRVSLLRPLFSAGPFPSGGDNFTVDLGFYRHSNPYQHIIGSSVRMVVETGERLRSRFSLPSGQSGCPFSPHYLDLTTQWQRQEYIELSATAEQVYSWPGLLLRATG